MRTGVLSVFLSWSSSMNSIKRVTSYRGKKTDRERKKRRRKKDTEVDIEQKQDSEGEEEMEEDLENLNVNEAEGEINSKVSESQGACAVNPDDSDGIFTVKIGPETTSVSSSDQQPNLNSSVPFVPHPRMNALLTVKHGILYLYGGIFEEGDKQLTLSDMYSLDLHKLDEWNVIIKSDLKEKVTVFYTFYLLRVIVCYHCSRSFILLEHGGKHYVPNSLYPSFSSTFYSTLLL